MDGISIEDSFILSLFMKGSKKFGQNTWLRILQVLSFKGNFISGIRLFTYVLAEPAQGKYFTSPSDVDIILKWLIDYKFIIPSKFRPDFSRSAAIGLIGYNSSYINNDLSHYPVPGHFVDWDYEVLFNVDRIIALVGSIYSENLQYSKELLDMYNQNKLHKSVVIHDSFRPIKYDGSKFDHERKLGISVSVGYDYATGKPAADLQVEIPYLQTSLSGELIKEDDKLDSLEGTIRTQLLMIAEQCKKLAAELGYQAQELQQLAAKDSNEIIDQETLDALMSSAGLDSNTLQQIVNRQEAEDRKTRATSKTSSTSTSPSRKRHRSTEEMFNLDALNAL